MIEIKVGSFIKEHIQNIIKYCEINIDEVENLQKNKFGISYPFLSEVNKVPTGRQRYWKQEYEINSKKYRFCSEFGGSKKNSEDKTLSEQHGEAFYKYFKSKNILLEKYNNDNIKFIVGDINNSFAEENELMNDNETKDMIQPLNQILYGPPGTGKTYSTIDKALEMIDGTVPEDREEAKKRFKDLKESGQIEFVTFHQSYGYEEFVEGIKAKTTDKGIEYKIESGIFKRLSENALSKDEIDTVTSSLNGNETIWKMSLGDSSNGEDERYYEEARNTDCLIMGYGNEIDFTSCQTKEAIAKLTDNDSVINAIDRFKNQLKNNDIVIISDGNRKFKAIVRVIDDYFFDSEADWKQKRKIEWLQRFEKSRDVKDISDRYFTQVTLNKPQGIIKDRLLEFLTNKEVVDNTKKNYILIIDEINRGNISKIFGELITLIEESKRLGNEEAMEVTLPYSGEKFGVPKNLYIIGTMNTADRSIALMDTALRRRFEFEEMMPSIKAIRKEVGENGIVDNIDIGLMLEKINQRIEYLYDRDHTLGHAYFMGIGEKGEVDSVMRNKVIPLLQEYFYDDWEKIRLVLNDGFIERTLQDSSKLFDDGMDDEYIEEDKYRYSIVENVTVDSYRKIYGKIEQIQAGE